MVDCLIITPALAQASVACLAGDVGDDFAVAGQCLVHELELVGVGPDVVAATGEGERAPGNRCAADELRCTDISAVPTLGQTSTLTLSNVVVFSVPSWCDADRQSGGDVGGHLRPWSGRPASSRCRSQRCNP